MGKSCRSSRFRFQRHRSYASFRHMRDLMQAAGVITPRKTVGGLELTILIIKPQNALVLLSSSSTSMISHEQSKIPTCPLYADDTSLCYQSPDLTQLNEAINSDLRKLDTWLQINRLSLNVVKLILCLFTQSRNTIFSRVIMKT